MTMTWVVAGAALAMATAAWVVARRAARQAAEVTAMFWQLKFDHGELKAKVAPPPVESSAPTQAFVPLSAIKRS